MTDTLIGGLSGPECMKQSKPAVMLVDDHELVLEGLSRYLERAGMSVVAAVMDAKRAIDVMEVSADAIDLVVVDIRLGQECGIDLVERLCGYGRVQVAVLTGHTDPTAASRAVRAGARGFFLKDTPCAELCANLRTVAEGNLVIDARVVSQLFENQQDPLTAREIEIVRLVGDGLTNREIGVRLHLSVHTVKENLSGVMRKLGTASRAATVVRATDGGWLRQPS